MKPGDVAAAVGYAALAAGGATLTYFALQSGGVIAANPRSAIMDMLTTGNTKQDFVRFLMDAAARARPDATRATRMLLTAWAAYESGWGKTPQAREGFNFWNVSKGGWTGPVISGGDTEYVPGSSAAKPITQLWRKYSDAPASVTNLLGLLEQGIFTNYRDAFGQLMAGDPNFATTLGVMEFGPDGRTVVRVVTDPRSAGYYTLPRSVYQKQINAILAQVSVLAAGVA